MPSMRMAPARASSGLAGLDTLFSLVMHVVELVNTFLQLLRSTGGRG